MRSSIPSWTTAAVQRRSRRIGRTARPTAKRALATLYEENADLAVGVAVDDSGADIGESRAAQLR